MRRVLEALPDRAGREGGFALLAPSTGRHPPGYTLFLADPAPPERARLEAGLEAGLCGNPQYAHARRIGQLGPARVTYLERGADWAWSRYQQALAAAGARQGDIKPTALSARDGWERVFETPPGHALDKPGVG